ncbi:MAG: hypothetical protein NVS3B20_24360 [Polyangiales bacterium]
MQGVVSFTIPGMRSIPALLMIAPLSLVVCTEGCATHALGPAEHFPNGQLTPKSGSVVVWGAVEIEGVDLVRSDVGWTRDYWKGERTITYDVTLKQARATCPSTVVIAKNFDAEGCAGATGATAPSSNCAIAEPSVARIEVTARYEIVFDARCAGDAAPYAVPASGDPRAPLAAAGAACFLARNRFKPEASWTSLYGLTELRVTEHATALLTDHPQLVARLFGGAALIASQGSPVFCRDDGAYLDGTPGRPTKSIGDPPTDISSIMDALAARAAQSTSPGSTAASRASRTPLTALSPIAPSAPSAPIDNHGDPWSNEQSLWERCNLPIEKGDVIAQERCQLLRQFDRFLRDTEDQARPDTPKGMPAPSSSSAPSAASASAGAHP